MSLPAVEGYHPNADEDKAMAPTITHAEQQGHVRGEFKFGEEAASPVSTTGEDKLSSSPHIKMPETTMVIQQQPFLDQAAFHATVPITDGHLVADQVFKSGSTWTTTQSQQQQHNQQLLQQYHQQQQFHHHQQQQQQQQQFHHQQQQQQQQFHHQQQMVQHNTSGLLTPNQSITTAGGEGHMVVTSSGKQIMLQERVISETSRVDQSQARVISERIIEHEVVVPKRVTREDLIEKIIVIPERVVHEEVIEDVQKIREKIVEIAIPVIQERVVEVPEIEYVEKVVEEPEVVFVDKVREVPVIEYVEKIREVPVEVIVEKVVEVPEIQYRETVVVKYVECPEIREKIVWKEVPVPQHIEKPIPEYVDIQEEREIVRVIPVPVEAVTTCEFRLPKLRARYSQIDVPLYVPRFVEVPVALDCMDAASVAQAESFVNQVTSMVSQSAVSLCEVETLAHTIKTANFEQLMGNQDPVTTITDHWMSGRLQVDSASMTYTTSQASPVTNISMSETVVQGKPIYTEITEEQHARAIAEQITPQIGGGVISSGGYVTNPNAGLITSPLSHPSPLQQHHMHQQRLSNGPLVGSTHQSVPSSYGGGEIMMQSITEQQTYSHSVPSFQQQTENLDANLVAAQVVEPIVSSAVTPEVMKAVMKAEAHAASPSAEGNMTLNVSSRPINVEETLAVDESAPA